MGTATAYQEQGDSMNESRLERDALKQFTWQARKCEDRISKAVLPFSPPAVLMALTFLVYKVTIACGGTLDMLTANLTDLDTKAKEKPVAVVDECQPSV